MSDLHFEWADLAFGNKELARSLNAIFIAAPRELSQKRFSQLVKEYLPQANIILGLAKEDFVEGFEGQPQFKMLKAKDVKLIIEKVTNSRSPHKVYILSYFQRDLPFIIEKLHFSRALFINGSWKHSFHTRPEFYSLTKKSISYSLLSPFVDETEARAYEKRIYRPLQKPSVLLTEIEMLVLANKVAACSFDYSFQTGVALGRKRGDKYESLIISFNKVVPYQTYALLHGASRERHFSPANDLNYYDAVHAEVEMIIKAQKECIELKGTTLFINLLPCPTCARMLTETDISEFIYREDHSSGYAIRMLESAGKRVKRIVEQVA